MKDKLMRIELQLKAIWYDQLMYCVWIITFLFITTGFLIKNISFMVLGFILFLLFSILTQILEKKAMDKIRREYENKKV